MGNKQTKDIIYYIETEAKRLSNRYPKVDQHLREELMDSCLSDIKNNVKPSETLAFDPNIKYIHSMCYPDVQLDAYKHSLWRLRIAAYNPLKS